MQGTLFDTPTSAVTVKVWPLSALLAKVHAPPNMNSDNRPAFGKVKYLAQLVGVSAATVHRAKIKGLNLGKADDWAIACGYHPDEIWDDWWVECA